MPELWVNEKGRARRVKLTEDALTIGRDRTCGVVLVDEKSSRRHCRLVKKREAWHLQELDSKNGTWVNGLRVATDRPLANGDVIMIGHARLVFRERMGGAALALWIGTHPALWRGVAYLVMTACVAVIGWGIYRGIGALREQTSAVRGAGELGESGK
ncbi:MAG: FHA domain-containing protein [Planctomycetes bacterium]|nr:FHA domain-containing protein [Planctomycetota bacterium]